MDEGFDAEQLKGAGFDARQLWNASFNLKQLMLGCGWIILEAENKRSGALACLFRTCCCSFLRLVEQS